MAHNESQSKELLIKDPTDGARAGRNFARFFRAESNAIWVGTAHITSFRLANKPIERFFHVLCGCKQ
jgi:hypothetical protein